ncbi:hypothetical protein Sya03_04900 [Spirilliplanes yamanashiensis]|uniref:TIR domain-containing protein n=1 Tax=Spirilliplanes yamanashiensis TaxID=42233 RepID=A0A8J4DH69_9ACTN|nr:hypothetical protein Sya03_04900 [Spirilliplanes yamanashiensis]
MFRDQTGLSVTPALWTSIQRALDSSEYFVLMASPEAAASPWVNKEIRHWVATKSLDHVLPVVTDGEWQWDPQRCDFTEDSTAVPEALRGVFAEEPLYLDLRWARDDQHLSLRHSRFRDAIAQLAAPMHGVSKDDLEGEDVRQHRRARRLWSFAAASLVVLAFAALLTGLLAVRNADRANAAAADARHQQQLVLEQRGHAERYAEDARRQEVLTRQQEARAKDAAAEVRRQESLARKQRALVAKASSEAERQQANARYQRAVADRAAARAQQQEAVAYQQRVNAEKAAAEALRQQQNAQEQQEAARRAANEADRHERIAREQEKKAGEAAAEAGRQQEAAISRRLMNQAKTTMPNDPQLALRLGLAAERVHPDAGTRHDLSGLVTSTRFLGELAKPGQYVGYARNGLMALEEGDGSVTLWRAGAAAEPVQVGSVDGDDSGRTALSPDGQKLVLWEAGLATLWDVSDPAAPKRGATLPGTADREWVSFSPDGRILATGSRSGWIVLWDVSEPAGPPRERARIPDLDRAHSGSFSSDSRILIAVGDKTHVWDIGDPAVAPAYRAALAASVDGATFHPTRPIMVTSHDDRMVRLWDVGSPGEPIEYAKWFGQDDPDVIAFDADGDNLVVREGKNTVSLWNVEREPYLVDSFRVTGDVSGVAVSPDGRLAVTGWDSTTFWNVRPVGAPQPVGHLTGLTAQVQAMAFVQGGRTLLSVDSSGRVTHWDMRAHPPVPRAAVDIGGGWLSKAAFSADGRMLAVIDQDNRVSLLDVTDRKGPRTLGSFDVPLRSLASMTFSPDGRSLALLEMDRLRVWNVADPTHPAQLGEAGGFYVNKHRRVSFHPDGRTVAVPARYSVVLFGVTGRPALTRLAELPSGSAMVYSVAISPDGRTMASGQADRKVVLWDVSDLANRRPSRIGILDTHGSVVESVNFSLGGHDLVVSTIKQTFTLWDVTDRNAPVRYPATSRYPQSVGGDLVTFSPDGHTVAHTGNSSVTSPAIQLWDYSELNDVRADPVRHACAIADRDLTAEEWALFVPERQYRRACG